MVDDCNTMKYGECKDGHLHAIRSQFLINLLNSPHEPMSYMFHREFSNKDRVFVADVLKIALFECPNNFVYMNSPFVSSQSSITDDNDSCRGTINYIDENLITAMKAKHEEILNNFKTETDKIIESFSQKFIDLHSEMDKVIEKVNSCKEEVARMKEEVQKQASTVQTIKKEESDIEENDIYGSSETLNAEIRAIKRDKRKSFIDYLKSAKGLTQPIIFPVVLNGCSVMAAHDPRVPHSIVSIDLLRPEDRWEEVPEHVFMIPWRRRKLQSCDECGFTTVKINGHSLSFEIFVSSYWTRKVLLGANFSQQFVDSVDEGRMKIRLFDDNNGPFNIGFEWFESARGYEA
ncbi:uncharacterized protein LOC135838967 [Planococcus citri]|uniref:uncharacterized protein LOC135838967 n=1 Tax=Planococcus citri TaxID=170843 RepID=UPI0031F95A62